MEKLNRLDFENIVDGILERHRTLAARIRAFKQELSPYFHNNKTKTKTMINHILNEKKSRSWKLLQQKVHRSSNMIGINNRQLLLFGCQEKYQFPHMLVTFDIDTKQWNWNTKNGHTTRYNRFKISIDKTTNILFLYNACDLAYEEKDMDPTKLLTLNLNSKSDFKIISLGKDGYVEDAEILYIENELRIFGNGAKHYVYNQKTKCVESRISLKNRMSPGIIYVRSKRKLFMFGGDDRETDDFLDDAVFQYDFATDLWTKCEIKLPVKMFAHSPLLTSDEKYILIFGCQTEDENETDGVDIYIWNLYDMQFRKSVVKCPDMDHFIVSAAMVGQSYNLLVNGYVRKYFHQHDCFPNPIKNIMLKWYCDGCVYLNYRDGNIWSIKLDAILCSQTVSSVVWEKHLS